MNRIALYRKGAELYAAKTADVSPQPAAAVAVSFVDHCGRLAAACVGGCASASAAACTRRHAGAAGRRTLGDGQYDTLVTVVQNDAGRVSSIQTDALQINVLKGRISEAACGALAAHTLTAAIPIGSLTGLDILAGRGFALHVPVRTAGYAVSDVQSVFSDAGVNQTVHRLMLTVHAEVCLSMAKTQKTETLAYEVCIAETVIVGEVPQFYANTGK